MGDRTNVTLTVLKSQAEAAKQFFEYSANEESEYSNGTNDIVQFTFFEVNYGELTFLHELREAGIAYDSDWNRGDEYEEGCEYCRYTTDGQLAIKTVYACDRDIPVKILISMLDNHEELKAYINKRALHIVEPSFDNQEQYGKLYRARQLIDPG